MKKPNARALREPTDLQPPPAGGYDAGEIAPAATSPGQQIAALREEIRRAGTGVARRRSGLRRLVWGLLGADIGTLALSLLLMFLPGGWMVAMVGAAFWTALLALAPLLLLALVVFPVPSLSRRRSLNRLRRQLAPLPREALADLLVPLKHDSQADTRHIAASLARDLGLPSEVTPAGPSDGRGDEPAGA